MPGAPGGSSPNAVGQFYVPPTAPSWSPITFQQPVNAVTTTTPAVATQKTKLVAIAAVTSVAASLATALAAAVKAMGIAAGRIWGVMPKPGRRPAKTWLVFRAALTVPDAPQTLARGRRAPPIMSSLVTLRGVSLRVPHPPAPDAPTAGLDLEDDAQLVALLEALGLLED